MRHLYWSSDRVKNAIEGSAWFGANDMSNEGGWEWSDGSGFRYINWNAGKLVLKLISVKNTYQGRRSDGEYPNNLV